jgi:threonine aldolase
LAEALAREHIRVSMSPRLRLVTHLDAPREGLQRTVEVFSHFFSARER